MLSWGEVRRVFRLEANPTPVMREKRGKKIIFWFRSDGNGEIAEIVTEIRNKGAPVEILWDEKEGLAGICIERTALRS